MKKVLIGAVRSKGDFKDGGKKIKYDNIKLYFVDYREFKSHGFTFNKSTEPVKIRTVDFEQVAGVSVKEFLTNFEKNYMFHRVRVIGEENDYGNVEVIEVRFSEETCFALYKKYLEERAEREEDDDEEDEEDYNEDDDYDEDFDFSDVDVETGEINVKKVSKKR